MSRWSSNGQFRCEKHHLSTIIASIAQSAHWSFRVALRQTAILACKYSWRLGSTMIFLILVSGIFIPTIDQLDVVFFVHRTPKHHRRTSSLGSMGSMDSIDSMELMARMQVRLSGIFLLTNICCSWRSSVISFVCRWKPMVNLCRLFEEVAIIDGIAQLGR